MIPADSVSLRPDKKVLYQRKEKTSDRIAEYGKILSDVFMFVMDAAVSEAIGTGFGRN